MRPTPLAWTMLGAFVGSVVVWPLSADLSLVLGIVGAAIAFAAAADALGTNHNVLDYREYKRMALRRLFPERDWSRKAPDYADEPQDLIFERERKRRGLR